MRVLIVAVGSRGDVAPFTRLGAALRAAGHRVAIAAYGMFDELVTASGLAFKELPGDPRLLGVTAEGSAGSAAGRPWLASNHHAGSYGVVGYLPRFRRNGRAPRGGSSWHTGSLAAQTATYVAYGTPARAASGRG